MGRPAWNRRESGDFVPQRVEMSTGRGAEFLSVKQDKWVWPVRRVEIFGSSTYGKIKKEQEVDNVVRFCEEVMKHKVMGCHAFILNMRSVIFLHLTVQQSMVLQVPSDLSPHTTACLSFIGFLSSLWPGSPSPASLSRSSM